MALSTGRSDDAVDGTVEIGPFRVTAVPVLHPVEAYGLRVEAGGRVLAYTGDTAACAGLDEVADGLQHGGLRAGLRALALATTREQP